MSPVGPVILAGPRAAAGSAPAPALRSRGRLRPGWPISALLLLYPLWWALGLGTIIVFLLAVPMAVHLVRRRPIVFPPGFILWLFFLICAVASTVLIGFDPPGTVAKPALGRLPTVAFDLAGYMAVTIVLLYAGNLSEREFPRRRLVRQLGVFFGMIVAGGLLGLLAPRFEFRSPVEMLLPDRVAKDVFVRSLVHPAAAQLQEVLGFLSPRPAAPFGFTNTWGHCLALLLGWFAISTLRRGGGVRRVVGLVTLALATIPVVYSLNRGLWISLAVAAAFVGVRLVARGSLAALVGLVVAVAAATALVVASPLTTVIQERLDNPHSDEIRTFTTERTFDAVSYSPVLGLGATRSALGSSNSIAVGPTSDCRLCGQPTLGSNGELWAALIAHGFAGALFYVGFLLRSLWVYRRDRSPIGDAGLLTLVLAMFFMLIYNALVMPLVLTFLALSLLWRNQREGAAVDAADGDSSPTPRWGVPAGSGPA